MMLTIGLIVTLSILIVIHEWGHYRAARMAGVRIEAFSIGFGPVLFSHTDRTGCQWRVSAVPLGGYVKMFEREGGQDSREHPGQSLSDKTLLQKAGIVFAGPFMNLALAFVLYGAVAMIGTEELSSRIGEPPAMSQAAQLGVESGWKVLRVGNEPVRSYADVRWEVSKAPIGMLALEMADDSGARRWVDFEIVSEKSEQDRLVSLGLIPYSRAAAIVQVQPGSAGEAAGLRPGDLIETVDGQPAGNVHAFVARIQQSAGTTMVLKVTREGVAEAMTVQLQPASVRTDDGRLIGRIGCSLVGMPEAVTVRRGPLDAAVYAITRIRDFTVLNLKGFANILTGQADVKQLSGPIAIGSMAGKIMQVGIVPYLAFLAMISTCLGVFNLLPIPFLDGGHLAMYAYQAVTRRPPGERFMKVAQAIGLFLILFITVFALGNDLINVFGLH